ncbi:MAG: organic hydroperoxide resistance protein [Chitinophagaceae bacterium]|nr:MAG: organic hydroperoxide resistance protein [Chitinophagaceae bacterium]
MDIIYTAKVSAKGGRNGHVQSEDGTLDVDVRPPGGKEEALNPEILFAGGYAACFGSALESVMRAEGQKEVTNTITAEVSLGKDNGAYKLAVKLHIEVPGMERTKVEDYAAKAHQKCPYSNATRGNVDVELIIFENLG